MKVLVKFAFECHNNYVARKPAIKADNEPLNTYGCKVFPGWSQLEYDRLAFSHRFGLERGAPLREELFKKIAEKILPGHFEWHDWTNKIVSALCNDDDPGNKRLIKLAAFPGCASAGKTWNVVSLGCIWWLCEPAESSVTLVSTTLGALRQRGWSVVQRCYSELGRNRVGNFIDSRMKWQWEKGNDKHTVHGRAVEEGNIQKVADDIKGVHTRRQMVIIDEATQVNEAILEAVGNLYSYPDEFILVLIGNPLNRLDQFGRFCEPDNGWLSVSVDTGAWRAKPFEKCGGEKPYVVTFDAEKSPNIVEGKIISRHLPKKDEVEAARRASGGGNTPNYWQNKRGFWPPEGISNTVFTESSLVSSKAKGKHRFIGEHFQIIGSVDPAFGGGDRPVLRFAKLGMIDSQRSENERGESRFVPIGLTNLGVWGIELMPPITLELDARSKNPIRYQLAERIKMLCEKVTVGPHTFHCPPENLIIDDTGDGGLGDILHRIWSPSVQRLDFRGTPSENPVSLEDPRPAKDVYKNKRAELYFFSRTVMDSGQLKGVDDDTAVELVNMEFITMNDQGQSQKVRLMEKKEYRLKFGRSPDYADTCVMLPEMARRRGFSLTALQKTAEVEKQTDDTLEAHQAVYEEEDEYKPEEVEMLL